MVFNVEMVLQQRLSLICVVADVLQLQLYRDSRDRAKGASTKASLALQNVLALETAAAHVTQATRAVVSPS
ncbi:hypothetical protein Pmani_023674 [Petrolisthes manimaculis]|uniref:Uncharacterized protein n=1 Tax=Petrolisthes manimaculis TaxID=1843537 RepID=A0AAE1P9E9_9EUCA|nr:hypothetical protein Pmani_023674 [Petrolisthes manimaculis]